MLRCFGLTCSWLSLLLITSEFVLLLLLILSLGTLHLDAAAQLEDPKSRCKLTVLTSSDV